MNLEGGARGTARLGLVSFLNSRPIGWGLLRGRQRGRFRIVTDAPSALADALTCGEIDLALLPSYEYARGRANGRDLAIVPRVCIASLGAAESVLLFSRVPPDRIHRVAVDLSSRTSVALLRVLFRRVFRGAGGSPEMLPSPPDLPAMLERAEAALLIGDPALFAARAHPELVASLDVRDLGQEWLSLTGLPFVFAVWAGPRREDAPEIVATLDDSLEEGLERIPEIARETAKERSDPDLETVVLRYLTHSIRYHLGREEIRGLETFFRMLVEDGDLPGPAPALSFQKTASCIREPR